MGTVMLDGYSGVRMVDGYSDVRMVDGYSDVRMVDGYSDVRMVRHVFLQRSLNSITRTQCGGRILFHIWQLFMFETC